MYVDTVRVDDSFMYGCFPIQIQYLTTALDRILFSSVVVVLAFGAQGPWFKYHPDLIFLPCICSFVMDFVHKNTLLVISYQIAGFPFTDESIKKILRKLDVNKDGRIDIR